MNNLATVDAQKKAPETTNPRTSSTTLPRTRTKAIAPWQDSDKSPSQTTKTLPESSVSSIAAKREISFMKREPSMADETRRHKISTDVKGNPVQVELSFLSKKPKQESSVVVSMKSDESKGTVSTSSSRSDMLVKAEESGRTRVKDGKGNVSPAGEEKSKAPKVGDPKRQSLLASKPHGEASFTRQVNIHEEDSAVKSKPKVRGESSASKPNPAVIQKEEIVDIQDIADEAARLHLLSKVDHKPVQRTNSRRQVMSDKSPLKTQQYSPSNDTPTDNSSQPVSAESSLYKKSGRVSAESSTSSQKPPSHQNSFREHKSRLQNLLKQRKDDDQAKLDEMKAVEMKKFGEWVAVVPGTIKLDDKPDIVKPVLSRETRDKIKSVFGGYRFGRRLQRGCEAIMKGYLFKVKHNFGTTDGILQDLQKELDWAVKLEDLLKIKPLHRAGDVIQQIDKILKGRVPEYAKSTDQERYHLCRWISMEKLPKNRVMLWEEHIVTCFYMILVGKVEFFKLNKDAKLPLCVFQAGSMFGHARIKVAGATRTACAVTASETWILTVDRDDFMSTSKKGTSGSFIDSRAHSISSLGIFSQVPELFQKIAVFFHFQSYERGEIIQPANDKIDRISFLISGSCKVTAVIPLIAQSNYGKVILKPCPVRKSEFTDTALEKCEEVEVETQASLLPGDWIPYIPLSRSDIASGKWTKETIFLYRFKNPCECQVTAEDKVVMASVPFEDFMDLVLEDTLRKFLDNTVINRYPMEELQAQYLSQNAWEELKKQTVQDIVNQKAEKKGIKR